MSEQPPIDLIVPEEIGPALADPALDATDQLAKMLAEEWIVADRESG